MNPLFEEIRAVAQKANPFTIVKGANYLYFCIQPTQETIVFQQTLKKKNMNLLSVYNFKDNIIGYLVEFSGKKKPVLDIPDTAEGAAIFFSNRTKHDKPELVYSDSKLRVLSFQDLDYFVSVKWKSTQSKDD